MSDSRNADTTEPETDANQASGQSPADGVTPSLMRLESCSVRPVTWGSYVDASFKEVFLLESAGDDSLASEAAPDVDEAQFLALQQAFLQQVPAYCLEDFGPTGRFAKATAEHLQTFDKLRHDVDLGLSLASITWVQEHEYRITFMLQTAKSGTRAISIYFYANIKQYRLDETSLDIYKCGGGHLALTDFSGGVAVEAIRCWILLTRIEKWLEHMQIHRAFNEFYESLGKTLASKVQVSMRLFSLHFVTQYEASLTFAVRTPENKVEFWPYTANITHHVFPHHAGRLNSILKPFDANTYKPTAAPMGPEAELGQMAAQQLIESFMRMAFKRELFDAYMRPHLRPEKVDASLTGIHARWASSDFRTGGWGILSEEMEREGLQARRAHQDRLEKGRGRETAKYLRRAWLKKLASSKPHMTLDEAKALAAAIFHGWDAEALAYSLEAYRELHARGITRQEVVDALRAGQMSAVLPSHTATWHGLTLKIHDLTFAMAFNTRDNDMIVTIGPRCGYAEEQT